ncbi:hypothetical protein K435DRAFT_793688 [Dendrothele bispora CBS 962.96]|uniref:Uncharacterized protein n=1 Tax=Dendrothele bispora (strain CBS 962.96) TaxID=1314807 RepID=A0A4V4HH13_DENBC|nr:hypothetical protein K435DRAFT_793688 [Dendrothele bispora CBS 962.96]
MQELSSFETRPQRLIKTQTDKLRDFSGLTIPPFAILSHRWSLEGEVVDVDAYDPSSKAANANAEHHDDISRNFGDVNGRYSETTVFHSSTTASDADDPSKSANANAEHHGGLSRYFGDVNGGYSEQDNRKIDRNIEKCGIYCEYTVNTDIMSVSYFLFFAMVQAIGKPLLQVEAWQQQYSMPDI